MPTTSRTVRGRPARGALPLPALLAVGMLLAACSDGGSQRADPVDLDTAGVAGTGTGTDTGAGSGADSAEEGAPAGSDGGSDAGSHGAPDAGEGPSDASGDLRDTSGLADLTSPQPGTWPVGDAGTVSFEVVGSQMVLTDVHAAPGWRARVEEEDPDEIEVTFRQGGASWRFEVELEDGGRQLEIEIDRHLRDAPPGSYDLADAGTFAFAVQDRRLVLADLSVTTGWTIAELDEDDDEFTFVLVQGPRRFEVEVELHRSGRAELDIEYEVVGPITR